ncbi:MAG: type II toxin-antitoxin system HicB family antitoxin [Legionellales bacterium]|jgi:predicted HicB family RNase H-like nuclease
MMEYKGYVGKAEFDDEADIFHGEVLLTRGVVTFQGRTVNSLKKAFHDSVDDYLAFCREQGITPEKPFSGKFVLRLNPEAHRRAALAAKMAGKSLNAWAADIIDHAAYNPA